MGSNDQSKWLILRLLKISAPNCGLHGRVAQACTLKTSAEVLHSSVRPFLNAWCGSWSVGIGLLSERCWPWVRSPTAQFLNEVTTAKFHKKEFKARYENMEGLLISTSDKSRFTSPSVSNSTTQSRTIGKNLLSSRLHSSTFEMFGDFDLSSNSLNLEIVFCRSWRSHVPKRSDQDPRELKSNIQAQSINISRGVKPPGLG